MTARRIAEARTVVVATPAYLQRHGTPMSPDELSSHEAVILTRGGGRDSFIFRKDDSEVPVALQGRVKVTHGEGLREAVICDLGVAVITEWLFTPELKSGQVVQLLQDWTLPTTSLSAVYPTGRLASARARAFVAYVEELMAA
jgi:DNA-binding transcriptional LysR family regulator